MNEERLKELLESGAITQEEFDEMVKGITSPDPTPDPDPTPEPDPKPDPDDKLEKLFQSKIDRAMAAERKEKSELKRKLERLQQKVLTDEEAKQIEFEEKQQELEQREKELTLEKNKMYAVKAMKKANLSDTEETMSIIERIVVSCEDETDIDDTIKLLKGWFDNAVKAEVEKRFKEGGYTPTKGSSLNGGKNPYMKDQLNLTEQMILEKNNPELAAQLKAAAGVK